MRFTCSERWEDMRPIGKKWTCVQLQKPVIDFTDWERDALVETISRRDRMHAANSARSKWTRH